MKIAAISNSTFYISIYSATDVENLDVSDILSTASLGGLSISDFVTDINGADISAPVTPIKTTSQPTISEFHIIL